MGNRFAVLLVNGPEATKHADQRTAVSWSEILLDVLPEGHLSPTGPNRTVPVWLENGMLVVSRGTESSFAAVARGVAEVQPRWLYLRPGVGDGRALMLRRPADEQAILFCVPRRPMPLSGPAAMIPMKGQLLCEEGPASPIEPGCRTLQVVPEAPPMRPADGWLNPVVTVWPLAFPANQRRPPKQLHLWKRLIEAGPMEFHPLFPEELAGRAAFLAWGEQILSLRQPASRSVVELLLWGDGVGPGPIWPAFLALDQLGGAFRIAGADGPQGPRRHWRQPESTDPVVSDLGRLWADQWGGECNVGQTFPEVVPELAADFSTAGFRACPLPQDWWNRLDLAELLRAAEPSEPFAAIRQLSEWLDGKRRVAEQELRERIEDHWQCCERVLPKLEELLAWLRDRAAWGASWLGQEASWPRRTWAALAPEFASDERHLLLKETIETALWSLGEESGLSWLAAQRKVATSHLGSAVRRGPGDATSFDPFAYLESFGRDFVVPRSPLQIEIPLLGEESGRETDFDPLRSAAHGTRNFAAQLLGNLAAERPERVLPSRRQLRAEVWWRRWAEELFQAESRVPVTLQERPGFRLRGARLGRDDLGPGKAISPPRFLMRF